MFTKNTFESYPLSLRNKTFGTKCILLNQCLELDENNENTVL